MSKSKKFSEVIYGEVFRILSSPVRMEIMRMLYKRDESWRMLYEKFNGKLSYHLKRLLQVGYIRKKVRKGGVVYGLTKKGKAVIRFAFSVEKILAETIHLI